jgi:hypothetical protein
MKVTIELTDQSDIYFAVNGMGYWNVCWDLDQWLRSELKYNDKLSEDTNDAFELVREKLREFCNDNGVKLDV